MANKKRMYKKGSFPGMEPYKMLTFGGMKKGKYQAAGPRRRSTNEEGARAGTPRAEAAARAKANNSSNMKRVLPPSINSKTSAATSILDQSEFRSAKGAAASPNKASSIAKVAGAKSAKAEPKVGNKLRELEKAPGPKAGPKPGTYAYAKKRNPNLDKLIAERKKYAKGTEDYNRVQNQINRAYDKGPMRKDISKVAAAKTPKNTAKPTLQKPASSKPAPKPAAKKSTPKQTPSGGSGMGAVQKEAALKNEINSAKPVDRRTSAPASSSSTSVADLKSQIKDARKASKGQGQANRQAAKISRLEKRLAKLQGKKMEPGGLKPAPNKGAASLPKAVRNKMGFMKRGGQRY